MENTLQHKLSRIKLLIMDVDGTLTDSGMYFSESGEELKRFSTRDGMGITLLRKSGIQTAILTSENSNIAVARAEKLKIDHVIINCRTKSQAAKDLAERLCLSIDEVAFIGDDVNDLQAVRVVGLSCCPSDAVDLIKNEVDIISNFNGGCGAVRELAEKILLSQNKPVELPEGC